MKMGKYLLLSTTVLGLINPLVTFADDNGASNQHNTVNNDKNINRKDKTQANDDKNQANDAKTLNSGDVSFPTSGQSGTVSWNIDSNGVLNMSGGVLGEGFNVLESVGLSQVEILNTIKEIKINGPLETTGSANNLFGDLPQLTKIEGLENLRTDNITDMTDMFSRNFELTDLNVSNFDTSNVVSMRTMFGGDLLLRNLDVSSFNTSKVTNMKQMFTSLRLVKKLDLSNFDTSNVTNMDYMLSDSDLLTDVDVSSFNTSNVKSMKNMFGQDYSLTNLDISSFDTTNTNNMAYFLSETPIHRLVLGKKTQLKGNDIELNNPDKNENYTGKWQTVGTGEDDNPNGDFVGLSNDIYARSTTNVSDTYVWQPNAVKAADVTVKYVDENGKQIENDAILTGNVGDAYKVDEKTIPGYIFAEAKDGNESGKFTDKPQTVTMIYKKLKNNTPVMPVQDGTLTVKYVDENGKEIAKSVVTKEKAGTAYKTEKKDIEGYVFKEVKGNEVGKYVAGNQTVTYVYTKNDNHNVTPTDPNNPDTPNDSGQTNQPGNNNTGKDAGSSAGNVVNNVVNGIQSVLPKTAAEKTTLAGVISVVLASLAGLVFWNRRK